ncbi:MAG: fibronectin type III domain-containing protein [Anaerolineae bacterium]
MHVRRVLSHTLVALLVVSIIMSSFGSLLVQAQEPSNGKGPKDKQPKITQADREAAAERAAAAGYALEAVGAADMAMPGASPRYFSHPNYANSPLLSNVVAEWNAIAQEIVQPAPMPGMMMSNISMATAFVYLAYAQAAVYDALVAIEGGYQPYALQQAPDPTASREAAVAAAAYGVLTAHAPSAELDAKYAASLAAIPDSAAKDAGIATGEAAAAALLALRADDGLLAEGTYTLPAPGPGVWEPTMMMPDGTMAPPVDPWMALLKPFLRDTPDQYRPVPPFDLASVEYATDLNEGKEIGGAASTTRTPEQTEVARFWTTNMVIQTNAAYRQLAESRGLGLLDTARLMAMGNMAATDSLIATFDAKYFYNFWRPITAIQRADTDGNDLTEPDTTWMPAVMTPNFPEWVAGHGSFVSAQAEVLTQFFGTDQIDLDLESGVTGTTRHYATAADLRTEIVNARTWGGLHFRTSSLLAVDLGQQLVADGLASHFASDPTTDTGQHAATSGGIRKFVDGLPGLTDANANNLGQYIPVAVPDTTTYPGSDYYEIAVIQYREKMHSDLPPTLLRGYVQLSTSVVPGEQVPLSNALMDGTDAPTGYLGVTPPHYLGPTIVSHKDRPVRIKFYNLLPTGVDGDLFIPVDTTVMGSGMGPELYPMEEMDPQNPMCGMDPKPYGCYAENRATLHLHGGVSPWISDGTPHQWITPAGEATAYPQGVSVVPVPDMEDLGDPNDGVMTFYYTNQQSARLMFYHDHSYGITRLNVYAGEAAPYLITDDTEQSLLSRGLIPGEDSTIALVIQDKTFVPSETQLATQDETWDVERWGGVGSLWMPHVYSPGQNPGDSEGVNAFGRWMYGPWFWPPTSSIDYGPVANPYYDPACDSETQWCEPPLMPGTPYNSMGMEAFMDTPVVNGTAYPTLTIDPKTYRFRVLNAANDRFFNLSLYQAVDANGAPCDAANTDPASEASGVACTEVLLNPDEVLAALDDATIVPTPVTGFEGPSWIQIGSEGGFLPAPVEVPAQSTTWVNDPTLFNAGNVDKHSLLVGPAERADVVVDFAAYAGQTLILYNDAPAAFPARDPRYDYYTGSPDLRDTGGVGTIAAGYGPNTRTVMQIIVRNEPAATPFDLGALENAFAHQEDGSGVFESGQHPIIVGQGAYNSAYGTSFRSSAPLDGFARIEDFSLTFETLSGNTLTMPMQNKQIQDEMGEAFDPIYGRMSGFLGVEMPFAQAGLQNMILYPYGYPPSEIIHGLQLPEGVEVTPIATTDDGTQLWKITHNGVDTHPIHWHLYEVQLLNRVGWDGIIRPPEASELGWKETLRVSPLEDTIVALRPIIPRLPFDLPNSVRLMDPTMPEGAYLANTTQAEAEGKPIMAFDPNGEPIDIINHYVNYGWEYVWHCHILSHEEMDMMRPQVVGVTPRAPTDLAISVKGTSATLTWADNSANETSFILERANDPGFTSGLTVVALAPNTVSYVDNTIKNNMTYYYRVVARNVVGDTWDYSDPNLNEGASFPTLTLDSAYTNVVMLGQAPTAPAAPTNLAAALQPGPQVLLTWRDNSNNETGFVIERALAGGTFAPLTTVGANVTSYTDSAVTAGNTYTYRVKAINAGGESAYTNVASVVITSPPAAPSSLTGTATRQGNNARITLNWVDNANNETGFTIQRATNLAFTAGVTTNTVPANTTTFNTGNVTRNTRYYFRVQAFNQSGNSAWSQILIIDTP